MSITLNANSNVGGVQLSTVSNSVDLFETWTINESAIMYIRPKTIEFKADGLKPNTQYYPFFNGVDISSFCSSTNGVTSSSLYSNSMGSVLGYFYLPASTFTCGSHTFRLVDSVTVVSSGNGSTMNLPDPRYGSAEAKYEANGTLKQQQKQIVTLSVINNPQSPAPPSTNPTPVIPDPIPEPPVVIYPPPQIPEPVIPPIAIDPPISFPVPSSMGGGCTKWFYNYSITSTKVQPNYTITSASSTPPSTLTIQNTWNNGTEKPAVTYLQSTKISNDKWNHIYSISLTFVKTYKRVVFSNDSTAGLNDTRVPLAGLNVFTLMPGFKPSGLSPSDVYAPYIPLGATTPWERVGNFGSIQETDRKFCSSLVENDPLAQSFYVNSNQYSSGIYVTSISVYFNRVDQSCPVTLELRNMENGYPGSNIFPGGKVILPGYSVMQSDNASIPTTFTFDQPIYLAPDLYYCFVLKSPSLGYDAWCSRFGDIDVVSGKVIDEQPSLGVLFKSSNDSTWQPNQYEDIKYDLNIAIFDINAASIVKLKPQKYNLTDSNSTPIYYDTKKTLPLSYIYTRNGDDLVTITIPMHGLINNDYIYIGDFPPITVNNIQSAAFKNKVFAVEYVDEDNINITVDGTADRTGAVLVQEVSQVINNTPPISIATVDYIQAIPFNNNDNTLSITPTIASNLVAPTPPSSITSSTFEVFTNIVFNEVMVDYLGTNFANTSIDEVLYVGDGNSSADDINNQPGAIKTINIDNNRTFTQLSTPAILLNGHNELSNSGFSNNGLTELSLKSTDKYLSPILDLSGMTLTVKSYKIDNQSNEISDIFADKTFVAPYTNLSDKYKDELNDSTINSEIVSGTGRANAKYKSKLIKINPIYAHKRINVFIVGTCPSPAVMDLYVRLSNDEITHIDRNWIWVPLYNAKNDTLDYTIEFNASTSNLAMSEWSFEYVNDESFTVADFKIVMRSTNNSITPKIYSIRAITNEI